MCCWLGEGLEKLCLACVGSKHPEGHPSWRLSRALPGAAMPSPIDDLVGVGPLVPSWQRPPTYQAEEAAALADSSDRNAPSVNSDNDRA